MAPEWEQDARRQEQDWHDETCRLIEQAERLLIALDDARCAVYSDYQYETPPAGVTKYLSKLCNAIERAEQRLERRGGENPFVAYP